MSDKAGSPSTFPASRRSSRSGLLNLFVSQAEIDKLKGELQLRQDVSVHAIPVIGPAGSFANGPSGTLSLVFVILIFLGYWAGQPHSLLL